MRKEDTGGQSVSGKGRMETEAQAEVLCFEGEGRSHEPSHADQQQKVKKPRKRILCSEPPEEPALWSPSPEPSDTQL